MSTHPHKTETVEASNSIAEMQLKDVVDAYPLVQEWRTSPSFCESRSVLKLDPAITANNLTATKLAGDDGIHPPYVFSNNIEGTLYVLYRLGEGLAGHRGILHGGLAGVLLDECLGRACFPLLAQRIAVTASLNISYRAPIALPGVYLVSAWTIKVEGRKAWVEGRIENPVTGILCVEAGALFIEPRGADAMSKVM